jgi:PAS domain S-box-containing protein
MTAEGHTGQTPGTGQYKAIVESITDPAYLLDSEQNIAYTNQLSLQYPAVSLEALRGGHVMDLIAQIVADDEDSAKFDRALEAVYRGDEDIEFPVTVKLDLDVSGGTTTREYRLSPCPTESGTGMLVVSGATTEHRGNRIDRQEQEPGSERTNAILKRLTETTGDIFWVFDSDYTEVQFVNDAYEDLWGRSVADLKEDPMDFMKGVHPDDRHIVRDAVEKTQNGEQTNKEYRVNPGEDFGRWVQVKGEPIYDDGDIICVAGIARDITEQKEREQRLKNLQERLNVAVKGAEIGTWDWDIDTDEVIFNDAWATMLGYTRDELDFHYDVWEELVHPVDLDGVMPAIEANMADETDFWEGEIRMETKSGDWKWVWTIGRVVERDEEGNPLRAGGIHIDIDDRKQAQLRLKQSERRFDAVFNDPQHLVSVLDTEGVVQRINETALNSVPATREQAEGTLFSELPWWTHDEMVRTDIEKRVAQATSGEYVEFESAAHVADDKRMALNGSFRPVTDDDGDVVSVVASGRDITERKLRKQELERKQNFLEQTQNVADVGGWEVDLRTDSLRWTEEVYRIHGLDSDFEPTVEAAIDLYHPEDQATIQDAVEMATTEGEPYDMEVRIVRPDGEVRWTRARGEPWYEDGDIVGVRGTFQDITERREREAQLKTSNERLEQFAYVASHDLQEPLRTISNYTEILAEDYAADLDEEAQRFIDVVVTGSERMQSMINGLLDYSRVTTRGGEFEPVDTGEVVADTTADLELMLDEHDGTVETGALPTVDADGDQLHQVFQNLVKNALEHSGEDPATIEIRGSEEPNQYRFEVEDDGPGIAKSRQEKIFRIFKSGEQYQTQSQAKGLGLAICDNIVRRHGGEIWVESEPDDGATFVFTIDKDSADPSSKKQ